MIPYTYDFDYYVGDTYPVVIYDGSVEEKTIYVGVGGYGTTDGIYGVVSTDLITWTQTTLPNPNTGNSLLSASWNKVVNGNGIFWATTKDGNGASIISARSFDGLRWSTSTLPIIGYWTATAFGDNKFVGRSYNQSIISTDLISFQSYSSLPSLGTPGAMAYGNGIFISTDQFSSSISRSTDGISWTNYNIGVGSNYRSIAFGNNKFVTVQFLSSRFAISTDGTSWTTGSLPVSSGWNGIAYGNGIFVATSYSFSYVSAYSTDGLTWTISTTAAQSVPGGITFNNNIFWTGNQITTNGITWTLTSSPGPSIGVSAGNGLFSKNTKYIKNKTGLFTVSTQRGKLESEIFSIPVDISDPEYRLTAEITPELGSLLTGASYVYDIEVKDDDETYTLLTGTITTQQDVKSN